MKRKFVGTPLASVKKVTTPKLSAKLETKEDEEGDCGYFVRVRTWRVKHPVAGFIVQEVTRSFAVKRADNDADLIGSSLDSYVQDKRASVCATETHYWELWEVNDLGEVSDGGADTFGLCALIDYKGIGRKKLLNTTYGRYTVTGCAKFYRHKDNILDTVFTRNVKVAGGLYATTSDPTSALGTPETGQVDYTVTVTWDSRYDDEVESKVVAK